METSRFERALNKLEQRIERVSTKIAKGSNVKPFDKEPIEPRQSYFEYTQMTPEQIQFARQNFGDMAVDSYIEKMQKIGKRYQGVQ